MPVDNDELGERLDRARIAAARTFGFIVSAALGGWGLRLLLTDDTSIGDGHIAAALFLLAAASVGLFAWFWPYFVKAQGGPGWKRLCEGSVIVGSFMLATALGLALSPEPPEMWQTYGLVALACVLYVVAFFTWQRHRNT